jgi:propionyl-CoA carboxylase alpha chain
VNGLGWQSDLVLCPRFPDAAANRAQQGPVAPVPGKIVLVEVALGQEVAAGDLLIVLEAVKVEHRIVAERQGIVTAILVAAGDNVDAHQVLVELEAGGDD